MSGFMFCQKISINIFMQNIHSCAPLMTVRKELKCSNQDLSSNS